MKVRVQLLLLREKKRPISQSRAASDRYARVREGGQGGQRRVSLVDETKSRLGFSRQNEASTLSLTNP